MFGGYNYELWNGKEVIGTCASFGLLRGDHVVVHEVSPLKRRYNERPKTFECPLIWRMIKDTGIEYTMRMCIDVRRKSKRQVDILRKGISML